MEKFDSMFHLCTLMRMLHIQEASKVIEVYSEPFFDGFFIESVREGE